MGHNGNLCLVHNNYLIFLTVLHWIYMPISCFRLNIEFIFG